MNRKTDIFEHATFFQRVSYFSSRAVVMWGKAPSMLVSSLRWNYARRPHATLIRHWTGQFVFNFRRWSLIKPLSTALCISHKALFRHSHHCQRVCRVSILVTGQFVFNFRKCSLINTYIIHCLVYQPQSVIQAVLSLPKSLWRIYQYLWLKLCMDLQQTVQVKLEYSKVDGLLCSPQ